MTRLTITMTEQEFERLYQAGRRELRQPRDQARHILRRVLFGEIVPSTDHTAHTNTVANRPTPEHI